MNISFPYVIAVTCTSLVSLFIGFFVLFNNKNSSTNRAFFLVTFATFLWLYYNSLLYIIESYDSALWIMKIDYTGVIFIAVFFYNFLLEFLEIKGKKEKLLLFVFYVFSVFCTISLWFSNFLINGLYQYSWGFYPKSAALNYAFVAYFSVVFYHCLSVLYNRYKKKPVSHKHLLQIKWIFIAFFISSFAIADFLPTFGINYRPFGFIAIFLFLSTDAYAILRHQLLDIEVIIKKTLIFTGIFVSVYAVFAFFAFLGQIFFERFVMANRWLSMIPSVIIITFTLRPLENFLINITDRYLFQKKYDYKELLKTFASEVLSVLELDKLIKLTEEKLANIMKLEYCKIIIADNNDIKTEASLKIPILIRNKQIGSLLLGKKKSDEEYTHDDISILQSLSNTLAIAISNANLVDELTKAQIKMAEKDKMATIGTLAAGMAHEIRNPITTIRVFSEYVPDRLKDEVFTNKYRSTVTKEVDKIDHIIQTLIDFSGEGEIQAVSGVSAYEAIEELVSIIMQSKDILGRVQFVNNIPPNLAKISVNKEELDEIILNLTQNAIHAISEKGMVIFSAEERDKSISIEISDTGSGMSEETVKHIFDPFFTTKSKGFGLGLFVVKELVQRNKGEIFVESRIGEGTKFKLEFQKKDN